MNSFGHKLLLENVPVLLENHWCNSIEHGKGVLSHDTDLPLRGHINGAQPEEMTPCGEVHGSDNTCLRSVGQ